MKQRQQFGHLVAISLVSALAGWSLRRVKPKTRGTADLLVAVT